MTVQLLIWYAVEGLSALIFTVIAIATLWSILVSVWNDARWLKLSHEERAQYVRDALLAALAQYNVPALAPASALVANNLTSKDMIGVASLDELVKAANGWLHVHGWPGVFKSHLFVTAYAHYQHEQARAEAERVAEAQSPAARVSARINEVLAGALGAPPAVPAQ